jgi:hypothetical protein
MWGSRGQDFTVKTGRHASANRGGTGRGKAAATSRYGLAAPESEIGQRADRLDDE